ncbi:integral membrane protein GPR155-like isoform X2 [Biomphalaria pfeifferi]|uniref:Integral membrane protein GPR155-like isoform X2 n=1 Tax=Biomphalaria pfeifferi TaxID=112525 RepID=A0AAD8BG61_BIOPF|nr:integral membrane protein GPR155-like isoform X2 [Biomphalaria pfeifferi]
MNESSDFHDVFTSSDDSDVSYDNLLRAISKCFVVIVGSYIAGRVGLITPTQSSGIGTFVSKFCLPALLFKSMLELKFSEVNWLFLLGILIAKVFLFVLVGLITLLVKRPMNLGYAAIFGIFTTQSNDFALGYPIVQALYGKTHPDFLKYLYLIAPISLVLINPIGFTLMELHKYKSVEEESSSKLKIAVLHVVKGVLLNPIVFMTAIGVIGNFIFAGSIPGYLDDILTMLGDAYNASALFYLGLSMVGKVRSQLGIGILVPLSLITAKTLFLPLITWEVVGWMENGNISTSYSMYAFLYGTFPTAPSVFLYASDYGIAQDVIATALVLGTFLSAPLMFVSAKMVTLIVNTGTAYKNVLSETSFDVSIISIVCSVWVVGLFVASGKWKRVPHRFTMAFIFSHILSCIGMITFYCNGETANWFHYPIIICLLVGVFSTRCWTAAMAIALCLLHVRSLCYVLRKQIWFYFIGFGIPVLSTGVLFLIGSHNMKDAIDPAFHYGTLQACFSLVILLFCLLVTLFSLIWWQRQEKQIVYQRLDSQRHSSTNSCIPITNTNGENVDSAENTIDEKPPLIDSLIESKRSSVQVSDDSFKDATETNVRKHYHSYSEEHTLKKAASIEDLFPYNSNFSDDVFTEYESSGADAMESVSERTCLLNQCSNEQRYVCMDRLRSYTATSLVNGDSPQEEEPKTVRELNKEEYQTAHHLILLLILLLSMFTGLFLCAWKVFHSEPTGIYVEIEFLDSFFNYGQGLFVLMVFGFDTKLVFSPIVRRLRRLFFGAEVLRLPKLNDLDAPTKQTCQQFTDYHKENCIRDIVRDRRFRYQTFKKVFTGTALCDWLMRVGLASDRSEAVSYGRHLVLGRVITHLTSEHNFHDAPYFYKFLDTFDYVSC